MEDLIRRYSDEAAKRARCRKRLSRTVISAARFALVGSVSQNRESFVNHGVGKGRKGTAGNEGWRV